MRTQRSRAPVTRAFSPVFEISRGPPQPSPRCRLPATAAAAAAITKHTTCPPFLTPGFTPLPIDVRTFFFECLLADHSTFFRSLIFQRRFSRVLGGDRCVIIIFFFFFYLPPSDSVVSIFIVRKTSVAAIAVVIVYIFTVAIITFTNHLGCRRYSDIRRRRALFVSGTPTVVYPVSF